LEILIVYEDGLHAAPVLEEGSQAKSHLRMHVTISADTNKSLNGRAPFPDRADWASTIGQQDAPNPDE
jgi:hypothetical protein